MVVKFFHLDCVLPITPPALPLPINFILRACVPYKKNLISKFDCINVSVLSIKSYTYYLLPITYYLLPITYYLLPITSLFLVNYATISRTIKCTLLVISRVCS